MDLYFSVCVTDALTVTDLCIVQSGAVYTTGVELLTISIVYLYGL